MASQVINGKAFEWAVGVALSENGLILASSPSAKHNKLCFEQIPSKKQSLFIKNAQLAIVHILNKESVSSGYFKFLSDDHGEEGDVRDIVVITSNREFGISCKTNHHAYKHSRLSDKIDFVKKWGLNEQGCSSKYIVQVRKIFGQLRDIKTSSNGTTLWRNLHNVPANYYWPILDAFEAEVQRTQSPEMCKNFVRYLIGSHDFYKVTSTPSRVEISGFNIGGSLKISAIKLPDTIVAIRNRNGSQYAKTISFNAGWEFNFRIHNASSKVEPSLKFDITATSLPPKLYQHHIEH